MVERARESTVQQFGVSHLRWQEEGVEWRAEAFDDADQI